jgi:UPF0755 protein
VRQSDRESITDADPHGLFFGPSDDDAEYGSAPDGHGSAYRAHDDGHTGPLPRVQRVSRTESRAERGHRASRRRNRGLFAILSLLLVVVVGVATWLVVLPIYHYLRPSDYNGNGTGSVVVEVQSNDNATNIGTTLHDKGVVASVRAFTDAAKNDARSQGIQPGSYQLHKHMSGRNALALLLTPSARVDSDVVITEGATTVDVLKRLTAPPCSGRPAQGQLCGPGLGKAAVTKALENVKAVGLPTDFTVNGKAPPSIEGFLFPAKYYFPKNTNPSLALQSMVTQFTDEARSTNFTAQAKALHITPYEELIVASIAQAEAKFPADYAKVARVILNRLAAGKPLQIDATSAYAAKLKGLDPTKVIYADVQGPYNTYQHDGLPPTPISNPGTDAMHGAAHPVAGNWTFYVNGDAEGHLVFTDSETQFEKDVQKCKTNHWGCG